MSAIPADPGLDSPAQTGTRKIRLGRKRIYILPTRYGVMFACVLLLMLLGSINYDNSLGYVLTFLLGSLSLVCLLHTYRNLAGITLDGGRASPVFAGQPAHFQLCFDNRGSQQRFALMLQRRNPQSMRQLLFPARQDEADWQGELRANKLDKVPIRIEHTQRGRLALGKLTISSSFPLGLFRAWSVLTPGLSCVVYPQPSGSAELPYELGAKESGQSGLHEGVDDFLGFREYYPGDSPKYIAWKSYARNQELLIKRFCGNGSEQISLDWDSLFFVPDQEGRLSQLCRWVVAAESRGLRYSLRLPGQVIPHANGNTHRQECLTCLALFKP